MDIRLQEEKPHQQSDNYEEVEAHCTHNNISKSFQGRTAGEANKTNGGNRSLKLHKVSCYRTGKGSLVTAGAGTIGDKEGEQGKGVDIGQKVGKRRDRTAGEMRSSNSRD